jgi:hypothetical protein
MGTCACKQDLRFKRLVVDVYPTDPEGDINRDAVNKLSGYVAHNPERIPRVCRKLRKVMDRDVKEQRYKRVSISVAAFRGLIASSDEMDYFAPHAIDVAIDLLGRAEPEYSVAAADLVTVVCVQLTHATEHNKKTDPGRLLADQSAALLSGLIAMAKDGIGTMRVESLHCRFAALVALGNVAAALGSRMADVADDVVAVVLRAMHVALVDEANIAADAAVGGGATRRRDALRQANAARSAMAELVLTSGAAALAPIASVVLPMDPHLKDTHYRNACTRALAMIAVCGTTAALPVTLDTVFTSIAAYGGWSTPSFATVVCHTLAASLQRRHQVGYLVCQELVHRIAEVKHGADVCTVLGCLAHAVGVVPMTGDRPWQLFHAGFKLMTADGCDELIQYHATRTLAVVVARAVSQGNQPAVVRMVSAVIAVVAAQLRALTSSPATADSPSVRLLSVLGLLRRIAPCAATISIAERRRVGFVQTLMPLLNGTSGDSSVRALATTCVATFIAAHVAASPESDAVAQWATGIVMLPEVTPMVVKSAADVLCALVNATPAAALPTIVDLVFELQAHLLATDPSPVATAWAHAVAAMVRAVGIARGCRPLVSYAVDVVARRASAGDGCHAFHTRFVVTGDSSEPRGRAKGASPTVQKPLPKPVSAEDAAAGASLSGIRLAQHDDDTGISGAANGGQHAARFTRETVALYLLEGNAAAVCEALHVESPLDAKAILMGGLDVSFNRRESIMSPGALMSPAADMFDMFDGTAQPTPTSPAVALPVPSLQVALRGAADLADDAAAPVTLVAAPAEQPHRRRPPPLPPTADEVFATLPAIYHAPRSRNVPLAAARVGGDDAYRPRAVQPSALMSGGFSKMTSSVFGTSTNLGGSFALSNAPTGGSLSLPTAKAAMIVAAQHRAPAPIAGQLGARANLAGSFALNGPAAGGLLGGMGGDGGAARFFPHSLFGLALDDDDDDDDGDDDGTRSLA